MVLACVAVTVLLHGQLTAQPGDRGQVRVSRRTTASVTPRYPWAQPVAAAYCCGVIR